MLMTARTSGICRWPVAAGGSVWSQHRLQSLEGGLEGEGTQQARGRSHSSLRHTANMADTTCGRKVAESRVASQTHRGVKTSHSWKR